MSKKDTTKQDIRSVLLRSGQVVPNGYLSAHGVRLSKEDSMKAAIAARKATFASQQKKEG